MSFLTTLGQKATKVGEVLKDSYGPLDKLEPSKEGQRKQLRYPLDVGNVELYPHTLELYCWEPRPADWKELYGRTQDNISSKNVLDRLKTDATKGNFGVYESSNTYLQQKATENPPRINQNQLINGDRITDWTRRGELKHIIAMYLPSQALQETFQNDYADVSMTEIFGALGYVAEAGSSINEGRKSEEVKTWDNLRPFIIKGISDIIGGNAAQIGETLIQAGGYATNPQLEVLYKGTKFRNFDFRFEFLPRSRKEADEILEIIHALKYHASPDYQVGQGRFITPPSFFDLYIKFGGVENERIPMKLSTCVLTGLDLDIVNGLNQVASFSDGTPVQMALQLRFTELEIMTKALRGSKY
jgi:hypothetical protein